MRFSSVTNIQIKITAMKTQSYIISFGNSTKYRITPSPDELKDIKAEIKEYLVNKFPQLKALGFYEKMTVTPVDETNEKEYAGYKEFNENSIDEIKNVLSSEVRDARAVSELNSNAPWGIGAEKS